MTPQEAAEVVAFVKEIIADEGRIVTFVRFDATTPDPTKPHKPGADPWIAPAETLDAAAVFVPLSSLQELGMVAVKRELYNAAAVVGMVEPVDGVDFAHFDGMIDDGSRYLLSAVDKLKPGPTVFLWAFAGATIHAA